MTPNLNNLPAPTVIDSVDFEAVLAERKTEFLSLIPKELREDVARTLNFEGDPINIILQDSVYAEIQNRQSANEAHLAALLATATGDDLDQCAANLGTYRLTIRPEDTRTVPPTPAVFESDESLRLRAQNSFESLTTAGSKGAWLFHAQSASGLVRDAAYLSPEPCESVIVLLSHEDDTGVASADLIKTVHDYLSDDFRLPQNDLLTVKSAVIIDYTINVRLKTTRGPEAELIRAAALKALTAYAQSQNKIGRDVTLFALIGAAKVEGVSDGNIIEPQTNLSIKEDQCARCVGITVSVDVIAGE
jgi:phage-related baseplate assembly protein